MGAIVRVFDTRAAVEEQVEAAFSVIPCLSNLYVSGRRNHWEPNF